ncbi:DNA polymerase III subunit beta [Mycoplasma sp. Pen4]|uniref:DNA polymerase III subunit beta n=1 Tax=Mycoplasma sp. Pen4 TaxID=640330 RepID=UPI0016547F8A|nr:DNA polymerase III subunit beta [Mycoplasma sp. Pen4]QNM93651.1 DNA polymerase III subunit beta [Mycoplasma sp. Pen4]
MKFTISKNLIEQNVEFLSNYIDSNDAFIPFRGIHFKIDSEQLVLTGASSTMGARKTIKVDEKNIKLEKSGNIYIQASMLRTIIKKFDKNITFSLNGNLIHIYEGSTKFTLTKSESGIYPNISFDDNENRFEIDSTKFDKIVSDVSISTSTSNDRLNSLIYKCINLKSDNDNKIVFIATDTYRLSTEILPINRELEMNLVVDAKNLRKLITKDAPKKVFMYFNDNKIGISYENTNVWTTVNKMQFMDVSQLFQVKFSRTFAIEREELIKTINKALFYTSEKDKKMEFTFEQNSLKISFEVPEIGIGVAETQKFEILEGDKIELDFNYNYVKEAAQVLDPGMLNIFVSNTEDKVLIMNKNNPDNIQLITPIRKYKKVKQIDESRN